MPCLSFLQPGTNNWHVPQQLASPPPGLVWASFELAPTTCMSLNWLCHYSDPGQALLALIPNYWHVTWLLAWPLSNSGQALFDLVPWADMSPWLSPPQLAHYINYLSPLLSVNWTTIQFDYSSWQFIPTVLLFMISWPGCLHCHFPLTTSHSIDWTLNPLLP